jgi:hypothetical protein
MEQKSDAIAKKDVPEDAVATRTSKDVVQAVDVV